MIKRICDKCKKEYNNSFSERQSCLLPQYDITKTIGLFTTVKIDLCNDCMIKFEEWLNQKEENE